MLPRLPVADYTFPYRQAQTRALSVARHEKAIVLPKLRLSQALRMPAAANYNISSGDCARVFIETDLPLHGPHTVLKAEGKQIYVYRLGTYGTT